MKNTKRQKGPGLLSGRHGSFRIHHKTMELTSAVSAESGSEKTRSRLITSSQGGQTIYTDPTTSNLHTDIATIEKGHAGLRQLFQKRLTSFWGS